MVCPACIALPVAVGAAITGSATKKNLILFQVSLLILIISILIYLYYKYWKNCKSCIAVNDGEEDKNSFFQNIQKFKERYFDRV